VDFGREWRKKEGAECLPSATEGCKSKKHIEVGLQGEREK